MEGKPGPATVPIIRALEVGPLMSNCYIVGSPVSKRAAVIDPGGDAGRIAAAARDAGLTIAAIVDTHAHFDHASGNADLKGLTGAPILVHREDAPFLGRLAMQALFFQIVSADSPPADRLLDEGDVIDLEGLSLKVLHTPGHTPGGIALLGPGMVFCGDTLFAGSVGRTDLPGGSWYRLFTSIRDKLLALPDETRVYPGHGPPTTISEERRHNPFLI